MSNLEFYIGNIKDPIIIVPLSYWLAFYILVEFEIVNNIVRKVNFNDLTEFYQSDALELTVVLNELISSRNLDSLLVKYFQTDGKMFVRGGLIYRDHTKPLSNTEIDQGKTKLIEFDQFLFYYYLGTILTLSKWALNSNQKIIIKHS